MLVPKAEHAHFGQNRPETREHLREQVCSATVAYARITHILSALGSKPLPMMINVAFTGEATPCHSAAPLRSYQAHPDVVFQRKPLSANGGDGQRLRHCAEPTALLQVAPRTRAAREKQ
ncbi:hypothetical protein B0H13DRAFT_2654263 [Mycena leptocephala]|nr:hypothetical protein B0H13DRAFT_2654263 [Mycena leptocephala]